MRDRKYFERNVMMAVEVEYEGGGRNWIEMTGDKVDGFLKKLKKSPDYFSDIDYCTRQPDEWCRKVLNTADWNWHKNRGWIKKMGFKSKWDVIDWIVDNKKVA